MTPELPRHALHAEVPLVEEPKRPERLVIVSDPGRGLVPVWWSLYRSAMWRCAVHGRMRTPACVHTDAATVALAAHLFGSEADADAEGGTST